MFVSPFVSTGDGYASLLMYRCLSVYFVFSRNKARMLMQMLSAEAFVRPSAQRTQQVWRPILHKMQGTH